MNDRILTWASTALAVGGAVCSVVASVTEGTATIVLWIVGLVLLVPGVAGLLFAARCSLITRSFRSDGIRTIFPSFPNTP